MDRKINVVEPIRSKDDLKLLLDWFRTYYPKYAVIFLLGISSGLRISDILNLNVKDVYEKDFVTIREQKTEKYKQFPLREDVKKVLNEYCKNKDLNEPLFRGWKGARLDRSQVYRLINRACEENQLYINVGTHTMRKTFGYHHYRQFHDITLLQTIFNHSSPQVTKRYIGITQDEVNESYISLDLFNKNTPEELKKLCKSRIRARRVESYIKNYLKNGGQRHKEFALDILDILHNC
ncbi:MAG: tyrosine-type recombinase/integrase [Clostridia bacterium]|nr:tyrosine-type recombinase/integrase [Clostridia bacterium]